MFNSFRSCFSVDGALFAIHAGLRTAVRSERIEDRTLMAADLGTDFDCADPIRIFGNAGEIGIARRPDQESA